MRGTLRRIRNTNDTGETTDEEKEKQEKEREKLEKEKERLEKEKQEKEKEKQEKEKEKQEKEKGKQEKKKRKKEKEKEKERKMINSAPILRVERPPVKSETEVENGGKSEERGSIFKWKSKNRNLEIRRSESLDNVTR